MKRGMQVSLEVFCEYFGIDACAVQRRDAHRAS